MAEAYAGIRAECGLRHAHSLSTWSLTHGQHTGSQGPDANAHSGRNASAASTTPGQQGRQRVCMLVCCGKTVLAMHEGAEDRRQREEGAACMTDNMQQDVRDRVRLDDD